MVLLAIDTSGPDCVVGLARGAGGDMTMIAERAERIGRGHAERLLPMIDEALASAGLSYRDIGRVGVATGPGSFTGVRVGVAAARGLALALGIEAIGVGSLQAIAEAARHAGGGDLFVAVLGRPESLHVQAVRADGVTVIEPTLVTADELARRFGGERGRIVLAGAGAAHAMEALAGAGIAARPGEPLPAPPIASVARLAFAGVGCTPPRPLYLRPPDARPQAAASVARA